MLDYQELLKYLFLAPGLVIYNTFNTTNTKNEDIIIKHLGIVTKYSVKEKIEILQKNLHSIRKLSGIKASDFSKKLYISKQTLNNWETDKNTINLASYGMLTTFLPTLGLNNPLLRCSTKTFATILFITFFPEYFTKKDFSNYQEIIAMLGNLSNKSHQSFFDELINELPSNPPFDMKEKFNQALLMPSDSEKNTEIDDHFLLWSFVLPSLILFASSTKQGVVTKYSIKEKAEILRSNLIYVRKISGLTAEAFAQKLSITKQTLNKWESDKYQNKLSFSQYNLLIGALPFYADKNSLLCSFKTYASILFTILCPEYFSKEVFSNYQNKISILCDLARSKDTYLSRFEKLEAELPSEMPFNIKLKFNELFNTPINDLYALSNFNFE